MKQFGSYAKVQAYSDIEKLPVGGYIVGILDAQEIGYDWGGVLEIKFDIAEGDFKNYYTEQYKGSQMEDKKYKGVYRMNIPKEDGSQQDEWTARRFKTDIQSIEDSNPGFHWDWDEKKLVGKKVGAVFFEKEWAFDGKTGFFTALHSFRSVETIKAGKFKIPNAKLLKNKPASADVFVEVDDDGDLPFN